LTIYLYLFAIHFNHACHSIEDLFLFCFCVLFCVVLIVLFVNGDILLKIYKESWSRQQTQFILTS